MKQTAGIFVDHRSIESQCINAFNSKNFGVNVFSDPTALFKSIVEAQLDVLVVDSGIESEDVRMIERYRIISPKLFIIILGENSGALHEYIEAGSNVVTDLQNIVKVINELQLEKSVKQLIAEEISDTWRLSPADYHLYSPSAKKIKLTVREYKFLTLLFETNKVVTKEEIKRQIIGGEYFTADQRIALLVARLRKKVHIETGLSIPIKSDYTNGYVFAGPSCIRK